MGAKWHRRIVCDLRRDLNSKVSITVLRAFVDDSGSGGDSQWYVLGGYIGTVEGWDLFDSQWQAVLDEPPKIAYFKSSEAESLRSNGPWAGVSQEARNKKIDALIAVIQRCAYQAIYIRVRQKDYDEIIKANVPPVWDDAYYYLFPAFISAAITMEKYFGENQPIEFVFDNHERFENPSRLQYGQMQGMGRFAGRIVNVLYRDEKKSLPLQAADLLAWQVRRAFCVPGEPRRAHFDSARNCVQHHYGYVICRKDLEDIMQAMEGEARRYAASLGYPLELLAPWKITKR